MICDTLDEQVESLLDLARNQSIRMILDERIVGHQWFNAKSLSHERRRATLLRAIADVAVEFTDPYLASFLETSSPLAPALLIPAPAIGRR